MKDSTYERLLELSSKTKNRRAIPLVLDYYRLKSLAPDADEERILKHIKNKVKLSLYDQ